MTSNASPNSSEIVRINWADFILTHGDSMEFSKTVEEICEEHKQPLVLVSFRDIQSLGSSTLGILVHAHNRFKHAGGKFCLCDLGSNLNLLMRLTKLNATLTIRANFEEGLHFLQGKPS